MKIYVITMYRFGDKGSHSYIKDAIADDLLKAIDIASNERDRRSGKYEPEVICFNKGAKEGVELKREVVMPVPDEVIHSLLDWDKVKNLLH